MERELSLFIVTFTTLLAIINPLEVLPVYLRLLSGKDDPTHRAVARQACLYSLLLCFFFFIFGTYTLRLFGVPLSMVRIVGGIILMRIGFELFMPRSRTLTWASPAGTPATPILRLFLSRCRSWSAQARSRQSSA